MNYVIDNFSGDICPLAPTRQGKLHCTLLKGMASFQLMCSILGIEITFHGPIHVGSSTLDY